MTSTKNVASKKVLNCICYVTTVVAKVWFFEAGGFYPDFILWVLKGNKQYVTFIEPHDLLHEGRGSEKIMFRGFMGDLSSCLPV